MREEEDGGGKGGEDVIKQVSIPLPPSLSVSLSISFTVWWPLLVFSFSHPQPATVQHMANLEISPKFSITCPSE